VKKQSTADGTAEEAGREANATAAEASEGRSEADERHGLPEDVAAASTGNETAPPSEPEGDSDGKGAATAEPAGEATGELAGESADDSAEGKAGGAPSAPSAPVATEVAPEPRRGGALGAALAGGAAAAVIGAGLMWLAAESGLIGANTQLAQSLTRLEERLAAHEARLTELQAWLSESAATLGGSLDSLSGNLEEVTTRVSAVENALAAKADATALAALTDRLAALEARLAALEVQPIPQAELPEEIAAAYEAKLAEMREQLAAEVGRLKADLEARVSALEAEAAARLAALAEASARAEALEKAAREMENIAAARAAHARLLAAIDAGRPFAEELAEITRRTGAQVPEALAAAAETGVPTEAMLVERFPEAARAALVAATRAAAERGEIDRWTAFLRIQLGARSLEPREGDDPDAILSRAEAALKAGDLRGALAEIEALPPEGRAAMADWEARARARLKVLEAAEALAASLPTTAQSN
jgi:uncharacterized coiled-coil protein SlyX